MAAAQVDPAQPPGQRRRGSRRLHIVRAAADLFAAEGYPAAGMDQIGAAAGITGPAIYRHFDSKAAILAAVFDGIIDAVTATPSDATDADATPPDASPPDATPPDAPAPNAVGAPAPNAVGAEAAGELLRLVRVYADAVAARRRLMAVFVREVHHLPPEHASKLAERQRTLVRHWRALVSGVHPEWDPEVVRTTVHGCFGMLNALGTFDSAMTDGELADTLVVLARRMLDLPPG